MHRRNRHPRRAHGGGGHLSRDRPLAAHRGRSSVSGRNPLGMGAPPAKPKNFRGSARRMGRYLLQQPLLVMAIVVMAVVAVALSVVVPTVLGRATDIIFDGFVASKLPEGSSKADAVAALRQQGDNKTADLVQ